MYIAAKTTDGDVLFWDGVRWTDDFYQAEEYGVMRGSFKMGELEVEYVDSDRPAGPYGARIAYIYEA